MKLLLLYFSTLIASAPLVHQIPLTNSYHDPNHPTFKLSVKSTKLCDKNVNQLTGYLSISDQKHIYFWFFESRGDPKRDPLVLWLNGGPGCSSFTGLLMELGPCRVNPGGNNGTSYNEFGWNENANLMFLDEPVGTGFSYSDHGGPSTSTEAAEDVYSFLQVFFTRYNQYAQNEFHIFGESYAGHYIPAIGSAINVHNKHFQTPHRDSAEKLFINLKSVAIGNGATDMLRQYDSFPKMAADTKYGPILPKEKIAEMQSFYPTCKKLMERCYVTRSPLFCTAAETYCEKKIASHFDGLRRNIYDIRDRCEPDECYPIGVDIDVFLNRPEIQQELGVFRKFEGCSDLVSKKFLMTADGALPYKQEIVNLLEDNIPVLIYAGDADWICNWYGVKDFLVNLEWSGKQKFLESEDLPWIGQATGRDAGEIRTHGPLTFIKVFNSGHMVPYDQPEHSLEMLNMWIQARDWSGDDDRKQKKLKYVS